MLALHHLIETPRRQARSYAQLLPWFGLATPALVICQDGSLLAGFELEGIDAEGRDDDLVSAGIDRFETALRTLDDRCTFWSLVERRFATGYPRGEFTSRVADRIDRDWARACARRRNAAIHQQLFIAYKFPSRGEAWLEALRAELQARDGRVLPALAALLRRRLGESGAVAQVRAQLASMAADFEKLLEAFHGVAGRGQPVRRLAGEQLLGALHARANPASPRGPVRATGEGCYLAPLLACDSVERRDDQLSFVGPVASVSMAALSMTGTPTAAHARQLDALMALDCEYLLVQCFRVLDREAASHHISEAEMFYRSEVKSVATRLAERLFDIESERVNTGNLHLAEDAQDALVELTAGELHYGWYNLTVLPLGPTPMEAEAACEQLAGALRASGFAVVRERHGLLPAFLTSLPGAADCTLRWKLASTANLADLAPLRTVSRGEPHHPLFSRLYGRTVPPLCRFMTPQGIPFDFNPHEGDVGHTAVVGGSGAGKTLLLSLLVSQFQKYTPSRTCIFDKDHSLALLTVMLGGQHIDLGAPGAARAMNPVGTMLAHGDDARLRLWLELLVASDGHALSAGESSLLHGAVQALRAAPPSRWRLSAVHALLAGQDRALAHKLAAYVDLSDAQDGGCSGSHAGYFDNPQDHFDLANTVALECGGLLEDPRVAGPFMDYAFYRIERALDGSTPTLILLDEAWYLLRNSAFAARFEDWLRTFRKKRAFVVFATQALDELARLPGITGMLANVPTRILLPSLQQSVQQQAPQLQSLFGLRRAQVDLLARAVPKRDYLLVRPAITRLVQTEMPPLLVAINEATVQPMHRAEAARRALDGGPDWQARFLREVLRVPD
jgi:type IV secretion system protein TrbE